MLALGLTLAGAAGAAPDRQAEDAYRRDATVFQAHVDARDWKKALATIDPAIAAASKAYGRNSEEVFDLLFKRAELYTLVQRYGEAIAAMEEALAVCRQLPATSASRLAEILARIAQYHVANEDLVGQRLALRRAVAEIEADPREELHLAVYLLQLGIALRDEDQEELKIADRVLSLLHKYGGHRSAEYVQALTLLGSAQHGMARFGEARDTYEKALAEAASIFGTRAHPQVVVILGNLASVYDDLADDVRRIALLEEALALSRQLHGDSHVETSVARTGLAWALLDVGDAGRARVLAERALADTEKVFGPDHHWVTFPMTAVAAIHAFDGDVDEALALAERALKIRRTWYGDNDSSTLHVRATVAARLLEKGRFAEAQAIDSVLIEDTRRVLGPADPLVGHILERLALSERALGTPERAAELFAQVLAHREAAYGQVHPYTATAEYNMVYATAALGDVRAALRHQDRCNRIIERLMRDVLGAGTDEQKRAYAALWHEQSDSTLTLSLDALAGDADAAALALRTILRRKGRALDTMADRIAAVRADADAESRRLLDALSEARSLLAGMLLSGKAEAAPSEAQRERVRALEAAVNARGGELMRDHDTDTSIDAVREALPDGAALVELALYRHVDFRRPGVADQQFPSEYAAYVLPKKGPIRGVRLGPVAAIDAGVLALRAALADPASDYRPLARKLHDALFAPIAAALEGSRHILLSPDGLASLVPMAALVDARGRHLVERFTFSYLTSGRDLLRRRDAAARQGPVLVGGPSFGGTPAGERRGVPGLHFAPLPATRQEVAAIAERLGDATVLVGDDAREEALEKLRGPRLLHLATHGYFLPGGGPAPAVGLRAAVMVRRALPDAAFDALLGSGIALAGANRGDGAQDGLLTAFEAASLDLRGTELVVLSGCDTGVGSVGRGEGVFGLRRALVLAGAETLVMSLWRVSDASTRDLMIAYYDGLLAGGGRSEAMRRAQLALAADPRTAHPHHWAAFIVSGETAPLSRPAAPPPKTAPHARGCGCEFGDVGPAGPWWLLLLAWLRRARSRPEGRTAPM